MCIDKKKFGLWLRVVLAYGCGLFWPGKGRARGAEGMVVKFDLFLLPVRRGNKLSNVVLLPSFVSGLQGSSTIDFCRNKKKWESRLCPPDVHHGPSRYVVFPVNI